jgi:hypothetical protein
LINKTQKENACEEAASSGIERHRAASSGIERTQLREKIGRIFAAFGQ